MQVSKLSLPSLSIEATDHSSTGTISLSQGHSNDLHDDIHLPVHMKSELNPCPYPCEITNGATVDWRSFLTYINAQPLCELNHLWQFVI